MCGYIFASSKFALKKPQLINCLEVLKSRGPDGSSYISTSTSDIWMGHTRLAIQDLQIRANQPFYSSDRRYVIVYNGEIYNCEYLRTLLGEDSRDLQTSSDTELILMLYIRFGVNVVNIIRGMFTFVIWDTLNSNGIVARDPYGVKPLYFVQSDEGLIFCSQIKPLIKSKLVDPIVLESSVEYFKIFGNLEANKTLYENINVFPAGHVYLISQNKIEKKIKYADVTLDKNVQSNNLTKLDLDLIRTWIDESIHCHLTGDVEVGVFLSGGIDSTVIATNLSNMYYKGKIKRPKSFTLKFNEYKNSNFDEAPIAKIVSDELFLNNLQYTVSYSNFLDSIDKFFNDMDSPSIDGYNTWFISRIARQNSIKAVLSGVGGDELFFGYGHMNSLPYIYKITNSWLVSKIRVLLFNLFDNCTSVPRSKFYDTILILKNLNIVPIEIIWMLQRSASLSSIANSITASEFLINFSAISSQYIDKYENSIETKIFNLENHFYLQSQLLRDSDWASMSNGIELRTPFVDYFLFEKIKSLIPSFSLYKNKFPLYNGLDNFPRQVLAQKKSGFNIPIREWYTKKTEHRIDFKIGSNWINAVYDNYTRSLSY